jgi:hypothetical protein
MIPKGCPFSDKQKLKLILHGRNGICRGHQEKNNNEAYELCGCCKSCQFFDQSVLTSWTYIPYIQPYLQPHQPTQPPSITTTTVPNTSGGTYWGDLITDNYNYTVYYAPTSYKYSTLVSGTSPSRAILQPSVV